MSFLPTLRMDVTADVAAQMQKDTGLTVAEAEQKMVDFFLENGLRNNPTFNSESITVLGDEEFTITKFNAKIVGWFHKDGIFHLNLATGDVVAVKFNIV